MHLIDRIQNKLELFRLESRYTKNRNRRSTFVSEAVYVDGEYVYASSNNTGSSTNSRSTTKSSSTSRSRNEPYQAQNRHKGNNVDFNGADRVQNIRSETEPYQSQNHHKGTKTRIDRDVAAVWNGEEDAYRQQSSEREKRMSRRWSKNWGSSKKRESVVDGRMPNVYEDEHHNGRPF